MPDGYIVRHRREVDVRAAESVLETGFLGVLMHEWPDGTLTIATRGLITDLRKAVFPRGGVPRAACAQCDYLAAARTYPEAQRALAEHVLAFHVVIAPQPAIS